MTVVLGAVVIAVVLIVVFPALFWVGYAVVSVGLGWLLKERAEDTHEGSELIATNV